MFLRKRFRVDNFFKLLVFDENITELLIK